MIQINPREIAAQALFEIMTEDSYSNLALKRLLKQNGAMPQKDRAFVTEIVNGTLRNINYIDYLINTLSSVKTNKMKPWLLAVMRTAIYQICFMKVPDSAACNEAVSLVKNKGFGKLAGFTNGVLRNIARKKDELKLPAEEKNNAEYLEILYSHPLWLIKMWLHEFDYPFVKDLCEKNNMSPDVTIACNPLKGSVTDLKQQLVKNGVSVEDGNHWNYALHLSKTSNIANLNLFQQGFFHIQDESSMTAVEVLEPQSGEKILDMCAAPGGKSFLIAEKMKNIGEIIARDIHPHKLELIEEGAERLGISIIKTQCMDATQKDNDSFQVFDRVLVDAPCSGLGLIRKKPDIRLKKSGNDIDVLSVLQREILQQAANYVKPGGVLVYSTCTICKKENQKNLEWFLENHNDYEVEDISKMLSLSLQEATAEKGWIRLFPHIHDTDGFFIARMRRKEK